MRDVVLIVVAWLVGGFVIGFVVGTWLKQGGY